MCYETYSIERKHRVQPSGLIPADAVGTVVNVSCMFSVDNHRACKCVLLSLVHRCLKLPVVEQPNEKLASSVNNN